MCEHDDNTTPNVGSCEQAAKAAAELQEEAAGQLADDIDRALRVAAGQSAEPEAREAAQAAGPGPQMAAALSPAAQEDAELMEQEILVCCLVSMTLSLLADRKARIALA